jgi:glycosyltransferase involved in cell wall biosynthesis
MSSSETISVVIVTHNQQRYVGKAIESTLNQTVAPDQILVVDDCSNDKTPEILARYEQAYSNTIDVVLLEREYGIPATRNVGIECATGDLITFLDGDDYFDEHKLERERDALTANDCEFAFSNFEYVDTTGERIKLWDATGTLRLDRLLQRCLTRDLPDGNLFRDELVRRSLLQSVGGYDEDLPILEDWDLRIRLAASGEGVYVSEVLTAYRQHGDGISDRSSHSTSIEFYEKVMKKHTDKLLADEVDTVRSAGKLLGGSAERRLYRAVKRGDVLRSVVYFMLFILFDASELKRLPDYAMRGAKRFFGD